MTTDSQQQNSKIENKEATLKELILKIQEWWRYLLSKWLVILIFAIIGAALGFGYAYFRKLTYTATTTFVLEEEKTGGSLGSIAGLASMAGIDLGGSGGGIFQGDNILGLYKSRTMVEQTLLSPIEVDGKKQLLVDRYIDFNKLREEWANKPALVSLKFSVDSWVEGKRVLKPDRLRDSVLGVIVKNLNTENLSVTKPDKKLSAIQVDVIAKDEIFAKSFNDELVKNVNEFYVNTKTKKTLQNVKILQQKTDSVRAVMNGAIYTAVAVADATPNLNPTRQVQRVVPAQRAQFTAESNKAIYAEMVKNLELTKLSLSKETPLIQIVDQPIFPLKTDKLGKVKGALNGAIIFGFLATLIFVIRKIYLQAMR